MLNTILAQTVVNEQAEIVADLLRDGYLDIFDGEQPESPETALTDQVYFCSARFSGFTEAADGKIYALPITNAVVFETGTVTWARFYQADHKTAVMDVSVGGPDSGCNMEIKRAELARGDVLEVLAFEHSISTSTAGR